MRNAKESSLAELRPPRLHSLTGLKVIALILIFIWHALPQEGLPDLGARCCEVMFASSGFLVAYNRHDRFGATLDSAWDYLRNKIKAIYPVYLTSLLATILYLVLSNHGMMWVTKESIASLTWHILLLQAWFPAISMQYNGLAWFLSALLFCYATAPFMSVIVKKICGWLEDRKWIGYLATFIMLAGIRWYIEWCNHLNGSEYPMSLYVNPVLRCLEFSMAYVVGAWYSSQGIEIVRRASRCHILAGGGAEVFVVLAYIWSVVVFDETWWRFHYVLVSTVLVSVLALSMGPISWLLTNKLFEVFSRFEIEFYLFHQVIIKYVWIILPALSLSGTTMSAVVGLGLSIAVSCAYIVIAKRVSRLLGAWRQRGLMRRDGSTQQK